MRRLVTIVLLVVMVASIPVAAHGNAIEADTQMSADGTVTIELLTVVTDGFVVLHAADGDEIGPVVGYTDPGEDPVHTDLTVHIDQVYWQNVTNRTTLFAALHRNEGDAGFDPATDPIQQSAAGDNVAAKFSVGKTDGNRTYVAAETGHAQEVNTSEVTVRRADLATDGYLVVKANDGGVPGQIVGKTALPAGTHQNVRVDIDDHFYAHRSERFSVWVTVHRADGDGAFDAEMDGPVTVNGEPIQTQVTLHRTDDIEEHDHGTPTPIPTATPESSHDAHDHTHTETTAAPSPTPTSTPVSSPTTTMAAGAEPTTGQAPGFGLVVGLVGLLLAVLTVARRR